MTTKPATSINLASQPFRRERADIATFAAICAILICTLGVLLGLVLHARAQASDIRRQIDREQVLLTQLRRQQNLYSSVLTKPENADTFAESAFLNQIISRRGISWTRVFQDLATVMPHNVRLITVRLPQIDLESEKGANRVQLDMFVGATQPESVIALFKSLQKSPLFGAASLLSQAPPTQNEPLFRYRVMVPYDQKL